MGLFSKKIKSQPQPAGPVNINIHPADNGQINSAKDTEETTEAKNKINWFDDNEEVGQLSVDVFEKDDKIIIKSTVAGVKPEDIEVLVDEDMVTIRGKRQREEEIAKDDCYCQECYWGSFERVLKLPLEVAEDGAEAYLKNGVLTIKLAKIRKPKSVKVPVSG